MKLISLGGLFSELLASSVTPIIAGSMGWRAVNFVMGGGGLLCALCWFAFAQSAPTHFRPRGDSSATLLTLEQIASAKRQNSDEQFQESRAKSQIAEIGSSKVGMQPRELSAARKGSSPLALFKHPAVVATLWCKMASGNMNYTTTQWTPTYFTSVLGNDCTIITSPDLTDASAAF
jgi:hypothetical protein